MGKNVIYTKMGLKYEFDLGKQNSGGGMEWDGETERKPAGGRGGGTVNRRMTKEEGVEKMFFTNVNAGGC